MNILSLVKSRVVEQILVWGMLGFFVTGLVNHDMELWDKRIVGLLLLWALWKFVCVVVLWKHLKQLEKSNETTHSKSD